jgi:serine protease Do
VGGSINYDIAVLKVTGSEILKNSYATTATLGDSERVRVFDEVFAVGNPEGFGMAVTEGIISVDSEGLDMTGADGSAINLRVMRVSAAINEGNSGGGLYDEDGKLIGIVCAKRIGADIDNMAYAIPSNLAKNLADNIIDNCNGTTVTKVQRALIGVEITAKVIGPVADPDTGELYRAERVEVNKIESTCLIKDDIRVGDIINSITVDGVTLNVTRVYHVIDHMLTARVGSEISVNVTRDGESFDIEFIVTPSTIKAEK